MKHALGLSILLFLAVTQMFAQSLANNKMVMLVRVGNDADGDPLFRVADSSEATYRQLYDRFYSNSGIQEVIDAHQEVELSVAQKNIPVGMHLDTQASPVYIQVGSGTGTYNEWAGNFSIQTNSGQTTKYSEPRVVVDTNDSMFASSDTSLVEQTIVHEIGHGMHAKAVGRDKLPETPYLGKEHYGDLVTDGSLSLIEGWAEFVGAYFTGRNTIAEDPRESISQNAYAYQNDGTPKSPDNLFKTEGWAATVMFHIANHANIVDGFEKLTKALQEGAPQDFNELLTIYMQQNPTDVKNIQEILLKDSINQVSTPLGWTTGTVQASVDTPPSVADDVTTGTQSTELASIFNDYQSSLNTYAQLKLDMVNVDWYQGAQYQEIARRMSFQTSLVQSLHSMLINKLKATAGTYNQEEIANSILDNLAKIRYEYNSKLESYELCNWWNQNAKIKLGAELDIYQNLDQLNREVADAVDSATMLAVWQQRMNRLQYRVDQAQGTTTSQNTVAAAPTSSKCSPLDAECNEVYSKLINAIKINGSSEESRNLLKQYNQLKNR